MSWLMRAVMGLALAFSAGAALAGCPGPCGHGGGYGDGYSSGGYNGGYEANHGGPGRNSGGYSLRTYGDVAQHYGYPSCGRCAARTGYDDGGGYQDRGDRYDDRRPGPCHQCGELILGNAFTYDYGVGPYPVGGYGGGGYGGGGYASGGGFAGAGASASASARASASASSSSQVNINIGGRGGHGGGGCNTCGGGHQGGGGTW